ncbi:hypothetical protein GAY28_27160 [Azospirillum brasilense]|nr:hypothetical protein [Azospirillum brasilense]
MNPVQRDPLPPASWGHAIASFIQGISLILMAVGFLLLTFGKIESSLSDKQKDLLLKGAANLGIIEILPEEKEPLSSELFGVEPRTTKQIASVTVPNSVFVTRPEWKWEHQAVCGVFLDPDTPRIVGENYTTYTKKIEWVGCNGTSDYGNGHLKVHYIPYPVYKSTPLLNLIISAMLLFGVISVISSARRKM